LRKVPSIVGEASYKSRADWELESTVSGGEQKNMRIDLRFILLLLCFFLSGFAALLYETAWAREFAFVFGTSEFAVVSVLAAYMGGLAAGAAVAARLISRIRRPILAYALLELGIAASALAVPRGISAAIWLQTAISGGQSAPPDEASVAGSLFYAACSFAILMIPTGLMGATLPLLARYAVQRESQIGRRVGVLYSVNTVGAVVGAAATGFVVLPMLGLRNTVYVGAATNALVFGAAALLARQSAPLPQISPSTSRGGLDSPVGHHARRKHPRARHDVGEFSARHRDWKRRRSPPRARPRPGRARLCVGAGRNCHTLVDRVCPRQPIA
jgi:hypothetical protein